MDKMKESVGLERQRNLIIKRYVTELVIGYLFRMKLCLARRRCLLAKKADILP